MQVPIGTGSVQVKSDLSLRCTQSAAGRERALTSIVVYVRDPLPPAPRRERQMKSLRSKSLPWRLERHGRRAEGQGEQGGDRSAEGVTRQPNRRGGIESGDIVVEVVSMKSFKDDETVRLKQSGRYVVRKARSWTEALTRRGSKASLRSGRPRRKSDRTCFHHRTEEAAAKVSPRRSTKGEGNQDKRSRKRSSMSSRLEHNSIYPIESLSE